jgi:hypothetical protein
MYCTVQKRVMKTYLMRSHVAGIASLSDNSSFRPDGAISIHLMHTVGLIVILALLALQARVQLGAHTYALPGLDQRHLGPDTKSLPNDLVANSQREVLLAPAATDSVHIRTTNTASLDLDLDIKVLEGLGGNLEGSSQENEVSSACFHSN